MREGPSQPLRRTTMQMAEGLLWEKHLPRRVHPLASTKTLTIFGVVITWQYRSYLSHKRARRVGHDFRLTHVHRVE